MKMPKIPNFRYVTYLMSFVVMILLFPVAAGAESQIRVLANGDTLISTPGNNHDSIKIQVVISQGKTVDSGKYKNAWVWGGDDGVVPKHCLFEIKLKINKKSVRLPFSSYADLGDVDEASIEKFEGGFDIEIHGGKSSYSYTATLRFRGDVLIRRTVMLNAFPMQRWEITNYSYTEVAN